ncbi:MAG: hypothetical protein PSV36_03295 [Algoriphagus sp.]|nr:hypothetical protein [Algoriphagus sp.]
MKNIVIALLLFGIIFHTQAQTEKLATTPSSLMEKSNQQYKAGWIFLGTGTALLVTALAIPPSYDYNDGSNNETLISVLGWTGAIAVITSVPLFLSAGQNARMAARLSLQNQALYQPIPIPGQPKSIPSLSLKIPL